MNISCLRHSPAMYLFSPCLSFFLQIQFLWPVQVSVGENTVLCTLTQQICYYRYVIESFRYGCCSAIRKILKKLCHRVPTTCGIIGGLCVWFIFRYQTCISNLCCILYIFLFWAFKFWVKQLFCQTIGVFIVIIFQAFQMQVTVRQLTVVTILIGILAHCIQ